MNCISDYLSRYSANLLAISDKGEQVYYSDIFALSDKLRPFFAHKSLVFQLCTNTIGSLLGYCAFQHLNVVSCMLSNTMSKDLLLSLQSVYRPNYLWLQETEIEHLCENRTIVFRQYGYCLVAVSDTVIELNPELSLLLSTSGTTGAAKLVKLSYKNLLANAQSIAEYLHITNIERPITSLPMNYSYGLSVINSHLIKGATLLMTNFSVLQIDFWNFFKSEKATSFSGVPYTYELLKKIRIERMNLPSLRMFTQAGGKLSDDLIADFTKYATDKKLQFFVMYGQTEATARMSYLPCEELTRKNGSIGIAIPGGKFQLHDEKGNVIIEPFTDGELYYAGDNVFGGYAESKADLAYLENIVWLKTGDIAHRDYDGFYYITGRLKRFVKLFGNRISLDSVEQLAKKVVSECACVGDDSNIVIYLQDRSHGNDVVKYLSEQLHLLPTVFVITYIEKIPKSDSGKILYSKLVELCRF